MSSDENSSRSAHSSESSSSANSSASSQSESDRSGSSGSGSGSSGSETYEEVPEEFEEELDTEASEGFRQLMSEYAIDFNEEPIGHGAFSIVRLGKTRKPPVERVAVKIVPVRFAKDVLKEAHTMMNLNHSSVLHMRGVFVGEKNVYLVTDYAAGGELFSYIRDHGWLPEETVAVIARKLLEGIKYLHDRGIVHRDLKPQNVLCATDDPTDIRIADFGLSKILSEDTMLKTCCGSPHYLAPEVLQCSAYDSKVDIWGIGIIVYIALTGCLPFFDDDMRKLIVKIMTADYTWPDDVVVSDAGLFCFPLHFPSSLISFFCSLTWVVVLLFFFTHTRWGINSKGFCAKDAREGPGKAALRGRLSGAPVDPTRAASHPRRGPAARRDQEEVTRSHTGTPNPPLLHDMHTNTHTARGSAHTCGTTTTVFIIGHCTAATVRKGGRERCHMSRHSSAAPVLRGESTFGRIVEELV